MITYISLNKFSNKINSGSSSSRIRTNSNQDSLDKNSTITQILLLHPLLAKE